jgi:hypothetical protein
MCSADGLTVNQRHVLLKRVSGLLFDFTMPLWRVSGQAPSEMRHEQGGCHTKDADDGQDSPCLPLAHHYVQSQSVRSSVPYQALFRNALRMFCTAFASVADATDASFSVLKASLGYQGQRPNSACMAVQAWAAA